MFNSNSIVSTYEPAYRLEENINLTFLLDTINRLRKNFKQYSELKCKEKEFIGVIMLYYHDRYEELVNEKSFLEKIKNYLDKNNTNFKIYIKFAKYSSHEGPVFKYYDSKIKIVNKNINNKNIEKKQ